MQTLSMPLLSQTMDVLCEVGRRGSRPWWDKGLPQFGKFIHVGTASGGQTFPCGWEDEATEAARGRSFLSVPSHGLWKLEQGTCDGAHAWKDLSPE